MGFLLRIITLSYSTALITLYLIFDKGECNTRTLKMARFDQSTSVSSLSCGVLRNDTINDRKNIHECLLKCYNDIQCLTVLYQADKCLRCNNLIDDTTAYRASGILHYRIKLACEPPWILWNGSCYKLSAYGNYNITKASCVSHGGQLVTVETSEENEFLKQFIPQNDLDTDVFYIGITCTPNNTWVLDITGQEAKFFYFDITEPHRMISECCIALIRPFAFKWADLPCGIDQRAVCEKSPTRQTP